MFFKKWQYCENKNVKLATSRHSQFLSHHL
jgi:hypothetical protein